MRGMMYFFLLHPASGQMMRFSADQFKSLLVGRMTLKSFARCTVKAAIVWVPLEESQSLTDSAQAVYPFLRFKADGTVDRHFIEMARNEVQRLGDLPKAQYGASNVINAAKIFEARRVANAYTWCPSDDLVREIVNVVNEQVAAM